MSTLQRDTPTVQMLFYSPRYMGYADWLFTGLGIMRENGEINFNVQRPGFYGFFMPLMNGRCITQRLLPTLYNHLFSEDRCYLVGKYTEYDKSIYFVCDYSDTPYIFANNLLDATDIYFKYQCPKKIDSSGFPLSSKVTKHFHPDVIENSYKIRAAMLGRPLAYSLNLSKSLKILRSYENQNAAKRDIKIYASFGKDTPPNYSSNLPYFAPYGASESWLMRTYSGQMEHPNCKRGKIVELLRSYKKNDIVASVFNTNNDAIRGFPSANGQYMETLRRSCCCVNISGRRRSVAYRFIDSLLSGAAVVTDNLAIRWHTDFNDYEVMQIGELGYECDKDINWMEIKEKMWQIYSSTCKRNNVSDAICNDYHNKWSPYAFARYIVKECRMELSKKEEIA